MQDTDWERFEVVAAIKKTGTTLSELSRKNNLVSGTLSNALVRKYPKAEKIIAEHLGVKPEVIWPSRYKKVGKKKNNQQL